MSQPLPFFYVHLVFFIVTAYLPILAYKMSLDFASLSEEEMCGTDGFGNGFCFGHMQDDTLTLMLLLVYLIVVIGLGKAAEQMVDPFGTDLVDIPVRAPNQTHTVMLKAYMYLLTCTHLPAALYIFIYNICTVMSLLHD